LLPKSVVEESFMVTIAAPISPEPQPSMGAVARILGVFFSPKSTFEDIVRKPSWLAPLVLITLLSVVVCVILNQRMNWREYIGQQMEKSPQAAQMSADQKEQRIEAGAKFAPIFTYVFGVPAPAVFVLVTTLVMWGAYNLLAGANVSFGTSFAIGAHASLVSVVSSVLFAVILFLKDPGTIDLENPVAANLAALLPEDSAKWLFTLCKQIDLFTFWILALTAIGFAAANPKKLKGGKAFTIVFSVWAVWVVLRVGWAFIWS